MDINKYQPIHGFFNLMNWDIPKKDFIKLWNIQKYLFKCEQDRQNGKFKDNPFALEKIRNLSAEYQMVLFSYPNIGDFS